MLQHELAVFQNYQIEIMHSRNFHLHILKKNIKVKLKVNYGSSHTIQISIGNKLKILIH